MDIWDKSPPVIQCLMEYSLKSELWVKHDDIDILQLAVKRKLELSIFTG